MNSFSNTVTNTFTHTHARQIGSKVAADLQRFHRLYDKRPSEEWIAKYETELVELLKHDAVKEVIYGFQRNGLWTEATVRYTALPGGKLQANDDPGKIRPNLDVAGAHFTSFLSYNSNWSSMSQATKDAIRAACGFTRNNGSTPGLEAGYWQDDHSYTAGGRGLGRSCIKI